MHFHNEKPAPPPVPASLQEAPFYEIPVRDEDAHRPPPPKYDSAGQVTPYLGLPARLSQVWFNRWTVLLALVLVRVLILVGGLRSNIGDAETQALAACTKVEDVGSAMASMPHYLSVGVNALAADGISKTVRGMVELLLLILTGVEALILFVINFYIGTYVCLSSALVHGGLDVGIGAADAVTSAMNEAISTITGELDSDITSVQNTINKAFAAVKSAASTFGVDLTAPTINITGRIDDLKSIKIDDTSFVKSLKSLNATVPTYDEAENFTKKAISIPFDLVKTALNNTYGAYQFNTSVFPVAKKQGLTFCSDNSTISDFFKALVALADKAKTAFVVVLVLLALAACAFVTWLEIRRWRSQQMLAQLARDQGRDPMDVVYIASRPYTARAGLWVAERVSAKDEKRQLLARWAVAYGTSLPALFVLSLAAAGLVSCACQAVLLAAVQKKAPALTAQVSNFAGSVVGTLESVSTDWATGANGVLLGLQTDINSDVLGYVTNATAAVNDTLNTFTSEIDKGINAAFNGTVLQNTVTQIVRCLIGIKIEAVEKGLTWVHDNAHVTLPLFPNDTFSAGASSSISGDSSLSSFLASPSSVTTDEVSGAITKVITALRSSLVKEALISTGLLLLYIIAILIGIVWALVHAMKPDHTRAEGGQRFYQADHSNSNNSPFADSAAVDYVDVHDKPDATLRPGLNGHQPIERKAYGHRSIHGDIGDVGR